jgi:hypothetical protein
MDMYVNGVRGEQKGNGKNKIPNQRWDVGFGVKVHAIIWPQDGKNKCGAHSWVLGHFSPKNATINVVWLFDFSKKIYIILVSKNS